jgi:hypothetical protein
MSSDAGPYRAVPSVTTPMVRVRPEASARAALFGRQPSWAAASSTRWRTSAET